MLTTDHRSPITQRLRNLTGWRRAVAAFVFGALTALAYPPISFFPILWLSFPAAIFLLQGTHKWWQAFITGWIFAFGAFVFGFYWIAASMFVDIAHFWWAVPLAVAGLPAFFAIYYGLAGIVMQKLGLRNLAGAIVFALLWFLADYARGHVFGGFPWNLEAYSWTRVLPLLQTTSLVGAYGLTLLTLLAASLPAILIDRKKTSRVLVLGSVAVLMLLGAWGEFRLSHDTAETVPHVRLRLVQPNIDQTRKWIMDERDKHFQELLDLSSAPAEKPVTHIIWPETAATFYLMEDDEHRHAVAAHVPKNGVILTGVIRRSNEPDGNLHYYNSLIAVDAKARVMAGYDKSHLVPFGEFIPLRSVLPLRTLVNLGVDFSHGDGPRSLRAEGLPSFSPLICYEAIFSGDVIDPEDRPHFLVSVTNDGWYGSTAGPYQHFAMVRVRAIEEGMPLVRAANTGISGVVDAYGRITARLGLDKSGFVDADLPQEMAPTFFSHYREIPLWIFFALLSAIVLLERFCLRRS